MNKISDDLLNRPITGLNLTFPTLGQELGNDQTLLVFLRHFG